VGPAPTRNGDPCGDWLPSFRRHRLRDWHWSGWWALRGYSRGWRRGSFSRRSGPFLPVRHMIRVGPSRALTPGERQGRQAQQNLCQTGHPDIVRRGSNDSSQKSQPGRILLRPPSVFP
jgi:hypothetical protein